jgi:hypothetical protein
MKDRLLKYLSSDGHLWWTVTVIPGIYSILYLYTNNFTLVNSWYQWIGFILLFIALPVVAILILDLVFKKWLPAHRAKLYWSYLFINFSIILSWSIYLGWRWKGLILVAVISIITSFFLAQHYKKFVLLLGLMTCFAVFYFGFFYVERVASWKDWTSTQKFESFVFKKKPNIYLIQPDGFVAKKAAINSLYQWEKGSFYDQLERKGLEINYDYRSNYPTTLSSNTALFTGQHHYFDRGNMEGELFHARDIIMGENAALNTLKSNGYTLNAILEHSYLLLNHPETVYDHLNVKDEDLHVMPDYQLYKDVEKDLYQLMEQNKSEPQFYFVEILQPGHIPAVASAKDGIEKGRTDYLKSLNTVTTILLNMVNSIIKKDPEAIIIIAADHGGFVGFKTTAQAYEAPTTDLELKQSLFNALFAIKAPSDFRTYQENIKSSVGVFPNLFSYLASQPLPIDSLDNSSYIFIKKVNARGVYKYYNTDGKPVTEKLQL